MGSSKELQTFNYLWAAHHTTGSHFSKMTVWFLITVIRQNKIQRTLVASFILLNQIASFIIFTHIIQGKWLFLLQRWEWASLIPASHHMALMMALSPFLIQAADFSFIFLPSKSLLQRHNPSPATVPSERTEAEDSIVPYDTHGAAEFLPTWLWGWASVKFRKSKNVRPASRVGGEKVVQPLILQMRPPNPREEGYLVQGHTARSQSRL